MGCAAGGGIQKCVCVHKSFHHNTVKSIDVDVGS